MAFATHAGKVAVVTGAARGFGQAIAGGLAERGAELVLVDLAESAETAELVRQAGRECLCVQADVASETDVERVAGEVLGALGRCDVLVNNVGIYPHADIFDLDYATWRRVLAVNLDSQFLTVKAFLPSMKANGWGRIVNVSSNSIALTVPGLSHYMASKMGVIGFTRGLANDVAQYGITVNAVGPTLTPTPGVLESELPKEQIDFVAGLQAIKRVGTPEDLVGTVLFLTSDDAHFVTGQTIMADGGLARV